MFPGYTTSCPLSCPPSLRFQFTVIYDTLIMTPQFNLSHQESNFDASGATSNHTYFCSIEGFSKGHLASRQSHFRVVATSSIFQEIIT